MSSNFKIFLWNCRGAASQAFFRNCKQFLDIHRPEVLVIMEPRVDPDRLWQTFRLLGFDGFLASEVRGYSGGIILGWKTNALRVSLLVRNFQFLHFRIGGVGPSALFFFTAVYASPAEENRSQLWNDLRQIAQGTQGPWVLDGDFNDITATHEKQGGIPASQRRCATFMDRTNACQLLDLGAPGPKLTWRGPLFEGHSSVSERLDWLLCNDSWRLAFPDAFVKVLARVRFLDHHPLLLSINSNIGERRPTNFIFESAWLTHTDFDNAVKRCWADSASITSNLQNLELMLQEWRVSSFGCI